MKTQIISTIQPLNVSVPLNDNTYGISVFGKDKKIVSSSTLHTERPPVILAQALPTVPSAPKPTKPKPKPPGKKKPPTPKKPQPPAKPRR